MRRSVLGQRWCGREAHSGKFRPRKHVRRRHYPREPKELDRGARPVSGAEPGDCRRQQIGFNDYFLVTMVALCYFIIARFHRLPTAEVGVPLSPRAGRAQAVRLRDSWTSHAETSHSCRVRPFLSGVRVRASVLQKRT
jgi:hypothetical protein